MVQVRAGRPSSIRSAQAWLKLSAKLFTSEEAIDLVTTIRKENVIKLHYGRYPMAWINDHVLKGCKSFSHRIEADAKEFVDFECLVTDECRIVHPGEEIAVTEPRHSSDVAWPSLLAAVHYSGAEAIPAQDLETVYDTGQWVFMRFSVPINPPLTRLVISQG